MKKFNIAVLIIATMFLSACNLFEKLDKKDSNDRGVQEFELTEAMNSGDYSEVITLVQDIIDSDAELKAIDSKTDEDIVTYLETNYADSTVQDYIDLKTTEAEALLGQSGAKLSSILSTIVELQSTSNNVVNANIQKSTTDTSSNLEIKDIIPEGTNVNKLVAAALAYYRGLPVSEAAFNALEDEYATDYLSGAITLAIGAVSRFVEYDETKEAWVAKTYTEFQSDYQANWTEEAQAISNQIEAAFDILTLYASDLLDENDKADLEKNADTIKGEINNYTLNFPTETQYNTLIENIGL